MSTETEMLTVAIPCIISIVGMIVAVLTYNNAVKERHTRTATEAVELKAELKSLSQQIRELKSDLAQTESGYHSNDKRITALEQRIKSAEARIKVIEERFEHGGC